MKKTKDSFLIAVFKKNFNKDFIYLFLDRGDGKEKEERNINVVASLVPPTGDLAHNPGMCPDWEPTLWFTGQCSVH